MNPLYKAPKGVIQLSYTVSKSLSKELQNFSKKEPCNIRVVRIGLSHQSDNNFCKYVGRYPLNIVIGNFAHRGVHVYLQVLEIQRTINIVDGMHYKLTVAPIKELPK